MAVRAFADLTWEEIRDLLPGEPVAIVPIGALEAHGPHLPLGTDVVIAEAMAAAGAERVAAAGREVLLLPAVQYTAAPFAAGFPGTVSLPSDTVVNLVVGLGSSLAAGGIGTLAVANAHFDPDHVGALRRAAERLQDTGLRFVFPDLTRRGLAERLTEEFRSGACHAGRYESSIVMAAAPRQVREERRADLPPFTVSLSQAIQEGMKTFEEAGGAQAYFGDPAAASAEEGRATIAVLGQILAEAILDDPS